MAKPIVVFISEEACSIALRSPSASLRLTAELLAKIQNRPANEAHDNRHPGRRIIFDPAETRALRNYFRRAATQFANRGEHENVRICTIAIGDVFHALWVAGEPTD